MEEASEAKKLSENEYLTMRFSPGYGDVPLIASEGILEILNAKKRIGMGLTESSMLIPIKSVTAFIGISDRKEHRGLSCDSCSIADRCLYRKRGDFCGIRNK
jgi:5-methyltetrahydrofolate--homocysteine methyltransferase